MRAPQKTESPAFAGPGLSKNAECACVSLLPFLAHYVNRLRLLTVVQFRTILVEGIALVGWPACPWLSRLVDRLTVLADALSEKSGVRA